MEQKCADPAIQHDIDTMILDYLMFTTTKNVLRSREDGEIDSKIAQGYTDPRMLLPMVNSYLNFYHAIHPDQHIDHALRFRLRLLRFTVLFANRSGLKDSMPSILRLRRLREQRQRQASSFRAQGDTAEPPTLPDLTSFLNSQGLVEIKQEQMSSNRNQILSSLPNAHTRLASPPVSLLDILPEFMALSAAQTAMQSATITKVWMNLAAGYMVQAAAEQYLIYDSKRPEVFQEAFAWGFDAECNAKEESDEWLINVMFFGEDEVVNGWDRIRDEHMNALIPPEGTDLREHLEKLLEGELSVKTFEKYILSFLTGLHLSQPRPLLLQVESGGIDGLSRKQARAFKKAVGLSCFGDA